VEGFICPNVWILAGGQWFNLLNLGKTEAEMNKLKLNEIMNGRLAMLAMFGYGAQAVITRQGPFQNLLDHLEDPVGNNLLTNFGKVFGA
jgi:light-harvesting complex I chlorophyll a/b binding protein 3